MMHLSLEQRVQRVAEIHDIRKLEINYAPVARGGTGGYWAGGRCEERYRSIKFHEAVFTRGPAGRGKVRVASLIPTQA